MNLLDGCHPSGSACHRAHERPGAGRDRRATTGKRCIYDMSHLGAQVGKARLRSAPGTRSVGEPSRSAAAGARRPAVRDDVGRGRIGFLRSGALVQEAFRIPRRRNIRSRSVRIFARMSVPAPTLCLALFAHSAWCVDDELCSG